MPVRAFSFGLSVLAWLASAGCGRGETAAIRDGVVTIGPDTGTGVAYAGTSLECGDKRYHITTGTKGGACTVTRMDGKAVGINCTDGDNDAAATCSAGCGKTKGAGDCEVKQQ